MLDEKGLGLFALLLLLAEVTIVLSSLALAPAGWWLCVNM